MSAPARKILDDLRRARAIVIHPPNEDGAALLEQLHRLGCEISLVRPPPAALPPDIDTVFIQLDDAPVMHLLPSIEEVEPAVIAVVATRARPPRRRSPTSTPTGY